MKVRGMKCGQIIELLQDINVPDGTEVMVEIPEERLISHEERLRKLKEFFETDWEGKEDFIKIMEELEKEKNTEWQRLYDRSS